MVDKNIFHKISYGVYVASTLDGTRPTGCIVNSVMQITSSPATFAVSVNHENYTNACMKQTGKFAISILTEKSNPELIGTFGFQSGKEIDKFEQVEMFVKEEMPIVADACGYIVCKIVDQMETNTHTVFLGEVIDAAPLKEADAMTYAYYHKVIKGKSPKNAPTYVEEIQPKGKWVCSICGYEYKGEIPFEELPEEFVCPLCKQPKSKFVYQL